MNRLTNVAFLLHIVCIVQQSDSQCNNALGMQDRRIHNSQIKASTDQGNAAKARLNGGDFWSAGSGGDVNDQWIQVDLLKPIFVTAVATQVTEENGVYGISFNVIYSNNSREWTLIRTDKNQDYGFTQKSDYYTTLRHELPNSISPINSRYIRILPLARDDGQAVNFRFELYGCEVLPSTPQPSQTQMIRRSTRSTTRVKLTSATSSTSHHVTTKRKNTHPRPITDEFTTGAGDFETTHQEIKTSPNIQSTDILLPTQIDVSTSRTTAYYQASSANPTIWIGGLLIGVGIGVLIFMGFFLPTALCFIKRRKRLTRSVSSEDAADRGSGQNGVQSGDRLQEEISERTAAPEYAVIHDIPETADDKEEYSYAYADVDSAVQTPPLPPVGKNQYAYVDVNTADQSQKPSRYEYSYADVKLHEDYISTSGIRSVTRSEPDIGSEIEDGADGWADNTTYATKNDDKIGSQIDVEGWKDNNIYVGDD